MEIRRKAVIYDLDGTLVDVRSIRHYVEGPKRDFGAFHKASKFCPPHEWVIGAARQSHEAGYANLIFTGRMEHHRALSTEWLKAWDVPFAALEMRPEGDYRKDFIVKRDMYRTYCRDYRIVRAYDDNPAIIDLWENLGVPVVPVPGWSDPIVQVI